MFVDVHCHLDLLEDISEVIIKSKKKKVGMIFSDGINTETNRKVIELSKEYKEVKAVLGIYPIEGLKMSDSEIMREIEFISENREEIVGIGEIGMDFKESKDRKRQEEIFKKFISLAIDLDIPITVHSRQAEEECIEILERLGAGKVIMHYFSGKMKLVERIIKNGWYLSIPTAVKNSEHFQEVIKKVSIEHLLCETDSPYSHPDRKFPNVPANVIESYKKIAEIKNIKLKEAEAKIEENVRKLFRII